MKNWVVLFFGFWAAFAFSWPEQTIHDSNVIDLRVAKSRLEYNYNYPGLHSGGVNNSDCLRLVVGGLPWHVVDDAAQKLVSLIEVYDGDAILFSGDGRELNLLPYTLNGAELSFYLVDLGKYLTGIRIDAKEGTLAQAVKQAFGDYQGLVGLQMLRGCAH